MDLLGCLSLNSTWLPGRKPHLSTVRKHMTTVYSLWFTTLRRGSGNIISQLSTNIFMRWVNETVTFSIVTNGPLKSIYYFGFNQVKHLQNTITAIQRHQFQQWTLYQIHKYTMRFTLCFSFFSPPPLQISPTVPNMLLREKKKRRCLITWSGPRNTETMWQPTS